MAKLHSIVGLITNSSSIVFCIEPQNNVSIDQVKDIIDVLWFMWKDYNRIDAVEDWFSGSYSNYDELPDTVSEKYSINEITEEDEKRFVSNYRTIVIYEILSLFVVYNITYTKDDELLNILQLESKGLDNKNLYRKANELSELFQDKYDRELLSSAIELKLAGAKVYNIIDFINSIEEYKAGKYYVDSGYDAAPESFSEFLAYFFGTKPEQIG